MAEEEGCERRSMLRARMTEFLERLATKRHGPGDTRIQIVGGVERCFLYSSKGIDPLLET